MAERFNLTAQLHLQAPRNVGQVVGQIRRQLHGINANVNVKGDARTIAKVNKELRSVDKHARSSAASVGRLNRNLSEAARRFSVITVATGTMLAFAHAVKNAVGEAISFERELVKISQVSGKSVRNLQGLTKEITRLSTSLGASSADLLSVSRTLTQAGFSAQKTKQALDILAKTSLGATFDDIKNTTEGAIAVLRQFRAEAQRTGGDIKFLEQTMDAINAVSKRFAVESNDLISVIRRVGGVFETAGGSVNELIALFTSVRATTRETAETIATGLRTIFTRIQRTETVDQLRQLGIELRNAQGQFVGSYEAVRRLSEGLAGLDPRDYRFSQIVEQLGGFRQIGKVIPLIRQFTTAQEALNVAQAASGSVTRDAITAQQSLAVQAAKVREEFSALMRNLADSSTFRSIANGALELAKAFIKVTEAITPVLPLLTTMIGLKIGRALAPGLGAVAGVGRGRATGGKIHKFSSGGFVPGVGNSDSVPAMLQPGEFVIKKSSAQKLGAGNLHAMNGYNRGGVVQWMSNGGKKTKALDPMDQFLAKSKAARKEKAQTTKGREERAENIITSGKLSKRFGVSFLRGNTDRISATIAAVRKESNATGRKVLDAAILEAAKKKNPNDKKIKTSADAYKFVKRGAILDTSGTPTFLQPKGKKIFEDDIMSGVPRMFSEAAKSFKGELKVANVPLKQLLSTSAIGSIEGQFFEAFVRRITDNVIKDTGPDAIFDFKNMPGTGKDIKKLFGRKSFVLPNEFKNDANSSNMASAIGKALTLRKSPEFFNKGGAVDSVPAMLTPGEYVINRSSAQSIGYSNLNKMNKTGVQHFARGGVVQYMSNGGKKLFAGSLGNDIGAGPGAANLSVGPGIGGDLKAVGGGLKSFGGALRGAITGLGDMANGMQSFIFLGGAVTALTSQMSGLSDTTKQAVNETAGFAVGLVGITGTVLQTAVGFAASTAMTQATEQIKQKQNLESAVTEEVKQNANLKSATTENTKAAAGAKLGTIFSTLLISVTAVIVTMKFLSAQQKAIAEESRKKWTESLKTIKDRAGVNAGEIASSMNKEADARTKSANIFSVKAIGLAAVAAGVTAAFAPFSPLLLGTVAAFAVFDIHLDRAAKQSEKANIAREKEIAAIQRSVQTFIALESAQRNVAKEFADIEASGLSPEKQLGLQLKAQRKALGTDTSRASALADRDISSIAKKLGTTSEKVRETGGDQKKLRKLATEGDSIIKKIIGSGKSRAEANALAADASARLALALQTQESGHNAATANLKRASQVYSKAADSIRNASNFVELEKALPAFAASLKDREEALRQSNRIELQAADKAVDAAAKEGGQRLAQAKKDLRDLKRTQDQSLKRLREGAKAQVQAVRARIREDLLAAKAAEALRKEMVATNKFMRDLGAIADSQAKQEKRLKNEAALAENKQLDFSVEQTTGIADLTMVRDLKKFEKELRSSIRNLPPTMRAKANDMVDGVVSTAKLINVAKEKMVGQGIKRGATVPTADEVLKAAGLDPTKVDGDIKRGMTKSIEEAFKTDRKISAEDFDKIFEPLIKAGQAQAKALSSVQQKYNKAVSLHTQSLNNQQMVLEKRTAAELRLVEIANKNEVMLAKARGMDDAAIGKILDRQERKTAQISLAGTGVRAGDLGGAVKAREAAQQRREQIAREIRSSNLSLVARKKLMTEDRKMSIVISRTTGEIKRLGDQSEKAGRLMDQIDAERAKREVLTGLVTDFVVGGQEERKAMQKSFMGIQFAMATGTLQTQSPEQRQATVGMLDTLADIEIPGAGGMTGREVKQKLVFDDAVRMGLDPKIAQQLAKATSKEEKLITALEKLTVVMEKANKVEAEGKAMGGLVHLAGGGSTIFKPRGTDTVPAMLTPGEFVIKKSSVDKYGTGMMSAINAGRFAKGGVVYAKHGTKVPPIDDRAYYESRQHGGFGTFGGVNLYKVKTSARSGTIVIPEMFRQLFNRGTPGSAPVFSKSRVSKDAYSAYRRLQGRAGRYPIQAALGLAPDTSRGPRELDPKLAAAHEKYKRPFDPSQFMSLGPAPVDPEIEAYRRRLRKRDAMTNAKKKLAGLPDRFAGLRDRFMATNFMADNQFGSGVGGRFLTGFRSAGKRARFLKKLEEQQAAFGSGVPKGPASMPTLLMGAPKFTSFGGRDPAVQASIDRANREEALFKAQQARQAPAQPAQTRGMPFAWRPEKDFDRVKQQRDKRHRIIASRQPRRYRDNHYNNPNSPYYRMTLDQALKKQKADKIIKSRARDKRMARQQRLQMRYGQRFADGGQVDSVPAMLTPGEFVMSRGAVQRYGTGFMSSLNRGNVPGFNSGGFVGAKYLQNGSTSAVKRGGGFNFDSLAGMLDTMTKAFPTLNSVITKLQNVFSDLNMTHNFKGDMSLAFSITNADSLKQSVADAITPHISDLITRELDNRLGGFNATGP